MKKKIGIISGIIIIVIVALFAYLIAKDLKQEDILKQEIVNLTNKNLATDDFKVEVKTKGDYAYIEESIKKYYQELSNLVKRTNILMQNEDLTNVLSTKNLEQEDENLTKSFETVTKTKNEMKQILNNMIELCTEEKILSLIDKDKVDSYYYDLYKELMYTEEDLKELQTLKKEVEGLSTALDNFLNKVLEMLEFLKVNKTKWFIENDELYFKQNSYVETYNKFLQELQTLAGEMEDAEWTI